jgi:hypothetical protein
MTTDDDLPRAEGLHEGDSGDEVRRLQSYLEKFGYLDSPRLEEYGVPRRRPRLRQQKRGDLTKTLARPCERCRKSSDYR